MQRTHEMPDQHYGDCSVCEGREGEPYDHNNLESLEEDELGQHPYRDGRAHASACDEFSMI